MTPQPAPDGPLVEVKELVGGYMIVTAATLEEAIEVARQCPGLVHHGSGVEVIEIHSPA
ncbi:MAG: YciI family protein [Vicinamibacterales bacterium]